MNNNHRDASVPPSSSIKNYVAIVLDESGSMDSMRQEAIDAFNQQLESIRKGAAGQETLVSLVKFNTAVPDPVYWNQPVGAARPITKRDYHPSGLTAMLDAVGLTISRLRTVHDAGDDNVSFLVVIISDGYENNSKEFSYPAVAALINQTSDTGRWTFAYLGSNQDLSAISRDMGIPMANTASFEPTAQGMRDAGEAQAAAAMAFLNDRRAGYKSSGRFYDRDTDQPPRDVNEKGSFWTRK